MSIKKMAKDQLIKLYDMKYQQKLKKHILAYPAWIEEKEKELVKNTIESIQNPLTSQKPFINISYGKGKISKDALKRVNEYGDSHPEVLLVYGDEDCINDRGKRDNPWLKPCWSPDTFLSNDYLGDALFVRKSLFDQLEANEKNNPTLCHRKLVNLANGFTKKCLSIVHLDGILFHREETWNQTLDNTSVFDDRNIKEYRNKKVSVIIPSKDNALVLGKCIHTVIQTVKDIDYEIIIVDNGSCQHAKTIIEDDIKKINQDLTNSDKLKGIYYCYEAMDFNFSKLCNLGVKKAEGDLLLFLNDDIEAVESGWMEQMASKASNPWVGAVGIKLWYPNSDKIQHAGITNISIGPVHKLQFLKDNKCYYDNRNKGIRNVLAVTAACMMMRKEVFEEAGGFTEQMRVAFNDVDLCFSIFELGYYNVVVNSIHMLHHESLSRGADESEEKMKRLIKERSILYNRHPKLENKDPFYHRWLNQSGLDTRIVPAFIEGREISDRGTLQKAEIDGSVKRNECLLVRIEYADAKKIQGYAVVLGSDNAYYSNKLVLKSKSNQNQIYLVELQEQYRSDIAENMPDQKNIALCGFNINLTEQPPKGEYKIGVVAKDNLSGAQLVNYSNRSIVV